MSGSAYPPGPPPGWYRDPFGQADGRYWNGSMWTDAVSRGGVTLRVAPDPTQATIPPVPGSELRATVPVGTAGAEPTPPKSSALPIILAIALVLAALAAGVLILRSGDDGGSTTTSTTPPATDSPVTTPPVTTPPVTTPPITTPPVTEPTPTTLAP